MKTIIIFALAMITWLGCFSQSDFLPVNTPSEDGYSPEWVMHFALQDNSLSTSFRNLLITIVNKKLAEKNKKFRVNEFNIKWIIVDCGKDTVMHLPQGYTNSGRPKTDLNIVKTFENPKDYYGPVRLFTFEDCRAAIYKGNCTNLVDVPCLPCGPWLVAQVTPKAPPCEDCEESNWVDVVPKETPDEWTTLNDPQQEITIPDELASSSENDFIQIPNEETKREVSIPVYLVDTVLQEIHQTVVVVNVQGGYYPRYYCYYGNGMDYTFYSYAYPMWYTYWNSWKYYQYSSFRHFRQEHYCHFNYDNNHRNINYGNRNYGSPRTNPGHGDNYAGGRNTNGGYNKSVAQQQNAQRYGRSTTQNTRPVVPNNAQNYGRSTTQNNASSYVRPTQNNAPRYSNSGRTLLH